MVLNIYPGNWICTIQILHNIISERQARIQMICILTVDRHVILLYVWQILLLLSQARDDADTSTQQLMTH